MKSMSAVSLVTCTREISSFNEIERTTACSVLQRTEYARGLGYIK